MSSLIPYGEQLKEIDILSLLPPDEGSITITYGRIGTGKTTRGTKNILRDLKRGIVVYANWKIVWEGYDERESKFNLFLGLIGLKRVFFKYPKENFHYFPITEKFIDELALLTSCNVHLDEGHIPFDSYEATRMDVAKRSAVFSSRHYDRSMYVYTQRANSVHINLRGNTNRFYKCEVTRDFKLFGKRFIRFLVTEFQDLTPGGAVDESRVLDDKGEETNEYKYAVSEDRYWGTKKIFDKFDSKYLRAGSKESQKNLAIPYSLTYGEIIKSFFHV